MENFQPDNIFLNFRLSFAAVCCLSGINLPDTVRPDHLPLVVGAEAVRDKNAPPNSPHTATRYHLIFPGSNYLRLPVKVDESAPSITPEVLGKHPGGIRVNVEGFTGGAFLTNDGGARPYFKAVRITPVTTQTTQTTQTAQTTQK